MTQNINKDQKEVKLIKNRKFIRPYILVMPLLLILLVSLVIGIVVADKPPETAKPDKPQGKPSPTEAEIEDFKIKIGLEDQDKIALLEPTHEDGIYLYKENVPYEYWTLPTKMKRKDHNEWGVQLLGWEGDDCGTYNIAEVYCDCCESPESLTEVLTSLGIDNTAGAYFFGIYHILDGGLWQEKADYWKLFIEWNKSSDPNVWHVITIVGDTNKDLVQEGTYNKDQDTWTVSFDKARFSVYETGAIGPEDYEWTGQLNFTVKIQRILLE